MGGRSVVTSCAFAPFPSQQPCPHLQHRPLNDEISKEEILVSGQSLRPSCQSSEALRLPKEACRGRLHGEEELKGSVMGMHMVAKMCKVGEIKNRWGRTLTRACTAHACTSTLTHSLLGFLGEEIVVSSAYKNPGVSSLKRVGVGGWADHKIPLRQTCSSYLQGPSFPLSCSPVSPDIPAQSDSPTSTNKAPQGAFPFPSCSGVFWGLGRILSGPFQPRLMSSAVSSSRKTGRASGKDLLQQNMAIFHHLPWLPPSFFHAGD